MLNNRLKDTKFTIFLKIVSTAIFAWSGFFWAGVSILNFYWSGNPNNYGDKFLFGSIFLLISLIGCWLRFYILQLPLCITGTILYLIPAYDIITVTVNTDNNWSLKFMPVVGMTMISLVFAMLQIWNLISKKIEKQNEFNNRPSKSILD